MPTMGRGTLTFGRLAGRGRRGPSSLERGSLAGCLLWRGAGARRAQWSHGLGWCLRGVLLLMAWMGRVEAPRPAQPRLRMAADLEAGHVSAKTRCQRADLFVIFASWLQGHLPEEDLMTFGRQHPQILAEWVHGFVRQAYITHWTRTRAAEAVLAVRDRFPLVRASLGGAWSALNTWAALEPSQTHTPCPVKLLRAMVVCALAWGWWRMATLLALGFYGLLRPCEFMLLTWEDVVLPRAHMGARALFVRILEPKTARRGARRQHVRIDFPPVVDFVDKLGCQSWARGRIFAGSPGTFRKRFETLLFALDA